MKKLTSTVIYTSWKGRRTLKPYFTCWAKINGFEIKRTFVAHFLIYIVFEVTGEQENVFASFILLRNKNCLSCCLVFARKQWNIDYFEKLDDSFHYEPFVFSAEWINLERIYPQTCVSSFPGLISVARVNE